MYDVDIWSSEGKCWQWVDTFDEYEKAEDLRDDLLQQGQIVRIVDNTGDSDLHGREEEDAD